MSEPEKPTCACSRPHYPLQFFTLEHYYIATRGTKPVENVLAEGWVRVTPEPRMVRQLHEQYDRSHRFDWLHTPTYLDDREMHLRMKEETRR